MGAGVASADTAPYATWGRLSGDYHPTYVPYINGTVADTAYDGACAVVYVDFGTGYTRNSYIVGGEACGVGKVVSWEIPNGWAAKHTYGIRMYLRYHNEISRYSTLCGSGAACRAM